jgi:hypothetical protein
MTNIVEDTDTDQVSFVDLAISGNMVGMRDAIDSSMKSRIAAAFEPEEVEDDEDE